MPRRSGGLGGSGRKYHQAKRGARLTSHYRERLAKRELTKPPALLPLDTLRKRQARADEARELARNGIG